jgi:ATP-dependent helicase HrpA
MPDDRLEQLKTLLPQAMLPDWVRLGSRLVRGLRGDEGAAAAGGDPEAWLDRLLREVRASIALREARRINRPGIHYPPALPITAHKDGIVAAIQAHQVVILAGETGSGKTTQLPKMCLEAGLGIEARIGCTQPRRVAALSISRRIAEELNVEWGREVGCKIRFDDRSSPHTYIKLMTDGILLAETQGDPTLSEYNAIVIDEAHERSLNIDFLLGYLKGLLARRPDLKLIVTSATIDTEAFSRHFDRAPIIEVSGRMYPVEIAYRPIDAGSEERGDVSYVDAAVQAAENIVYDTAAGDLLIFMPGERDIRETADQLEGRFSGGVEIIPLFGRLSAGDQQRVFAPAPRRKMVIATNIAETSLTIPGIRYVIDAGLARISRYNPRTRTRRLPIEAISQSSANQRAGRAGRMEDGVCIRLYAEEDFQERPLFTQPEIQRANLAEVILRMKAFQLGDIESFPFIQPPAPAAIAGGYALLQELGALDGQRALTALGQDLARLPIDPTLGRMLLQSQREHATRELLIIAAGLSIQDPRERPLEQKEAAQAGHRRFNDPQSDFLALLNIWNAVHDEWEKLRTQNQRRRFCRQNFLSYLRMREWQDLHAQLHEALADRGNLRLNESNAAYEAIHRSILAGLIGHVARREERNTYHASGKRAVTIFPGSALFERGEPPRKSAAGRRGPATAGGPPPRPTNQPAWIVAGEMVETSQLFARTVAGIDPHWIYQLAPHCCKVTHVNPHWSARGGRVLAEEVITLHGLEVERRKVAYGNINPLEATEIFVRDALVREDLLPSADRRAGDDDDEAGALAVGRRVGRERGWVAPSLSDLPPQYEFLLRNRGVRQKVENWQTRVRRYDLGDLDEALAGFYRARLAGVSGVNDLNKMIREKGGPGFLFLTETDLVGARAIDFDQDAFPDAVPVGGQPVELSYAYAPGEDHDGVTVRLPFTLAATASAALLEWAVPGLRAEKIEQLLRSLPKAIRRELLPLAPKVAEIVHEFQPRGSSFVHELGRFLRERYGVDVPPSAWPADAIPAHLRTRIELVGPDQRAIAAGRDLELLRERLVETKVTSDPAREPAAWQRLARQWERFGVSGWTFGDLPDRLTVSEGPGLPVYAWPAPVFEEGVINVRLFPSLDAARAASVGGVRRLIELALQKDFAWVEKDLRALGRFDSLYAPLGDSAELRDTALENVKAHVLPSEPLASLTGQAFQAAVDQARKRLAGLAGSLIDRVGSILQHRQQVAQRLGGGSGNAPMSPAPRARTLHSLSQLGAGPGPARAGESPFSAELLSLVPPRFLERIAFDRLVHLPRYLKALLTRIERAALNPVKDQERARQLAPFLSLRQKLETHPPRSAAGRQEAEEFRWMVEEFRVSLFAQELGTAAPVSAKRLEQQWERVQQAG